MDNENKRTTMRQAVKDMEQTPEGQAILKLEDLILTIGGNDAKLDLAAKYAAWLEEEAHQLDECLMSDDKDCEKIVDLFISMQHKIIRLNEFLHRPVPNM